MPLSAIKRKVTDRHEAEDSPRWFPLTEGMGSNPHWLGGRGCRLGDAIGYYPNKAGRKMMTSAEKLLATSPVPLAGRQRTSSGKRV